MASDHHHKNHGLLKELLAKARHKIKSVKHKDKDTVFSDSSSRSHKDSICDTNDIFFGYCTGNVTDRYAMGQVIGTGAFGSVRLCVDKTTGQRYACKAVPKAKIVTNQQLQALKYEAEIMLHLSGHPNIVKIIAFYEDPGNLYVIEELCEGGTLVDVLANNNLRMSEKAAAAIMRTVIETVAYCHSLRVIHRDIKLDNFLMAYKTMDAEGLRLSDFGWSTFLSAGEHLTEFAGTPEYAAPEVYAGHYSFPADIWSCGIMLHVLLSGRFPYNGTFDELQRAVATLEPVMELGTWNWISPAAKECIRLMLNKDPAQRPKPAEILAHPWFKREGVARTTPLDDIILTRLKAFMKMNRFKQEVLRLVATRMDGEVTSGLSKIFHAVPASEPEVHTMAEVRAQLAKRGLEYDEDTIREMFSGLKLDDQGRINYREWLAFSMGTNVLNKAGLLEEVFNIFDPQRTGIITPHQVMMQLPSVSYEEVVHMMQEVGVVDGRMDRTQFYAAVLGPGAVAQGHSNGKRFFKLHSNKHRQGLHVSDQPSCKVM